MSIIPPNPLLFYIRACLCPHITRQSQIVSPAVGIGDVNLNNLNVNLARHNSRVKCQ